jgi:hypothetical protein
MSSPTVMWWSDALRSSSRSVLRMREKEYNMSINKKDVQLIEEKNHFERVCCTYSQHWKIRPFLRRYSTHLWNILCQCWHRNVHLISCSTHDLHWGKELILGARPRIHEKGSLTINHCSVQWSWIFDLKCSKFLLHLLCSNSVRIETHALCSLHTLNISRVTLLFN